MTERKEKKVFGRIIGESPPRIITSTLARAMLANRSETGPYEYHRGFLARDRECEGAKIGGIADSFYKASKEGAVCLVQRRIMNNVYQYLAIPAGGA